MQIFNKKRSRNIKFPRLLGRLTGKRKSNRPESSRKSYLSLYRRLSGSEPYLVQGSKNTCFLFTRVRDVQTRFTWRGMRQSRRKAAFVHRTGSDEYPAAHEPDGERPQYKSARQHECRIGCNYCTSQTRLRSLHGLPFVEEVYLCDVYSSISPYSDFVSTTLNNSAL